MAEQRSGFKKVYEGVKKLEDDFPLIVKNQSNTDLGPDALSYTIANLLYAAHTADSYPDAPVHTRKEYLTSCQVIGKVPSGRAGLIAVVIECYPQSVFAAEHLFFMNRAFARAIALPDEERPAQMKGGKAEEWVIPQERVDSVRALAIELWKEDETEGGPYADENGESERAAL